MGGGVLGADTYIEKLSQYIKDNCKNVKIYQNTEVIKINNNQN